MACVAILLDILQKSSSVSGSLLNSYGSFGVKTAVSASTASFAAGRPLRSGILFGQLLSSVWKRFNFLHGLGLIHCDLKSENILVKSYSRCEVKVIELGSSCFETDHLCSYVQSRSYCAPEVILGLPYDKKIDIWSLGCVLAELCTGNVLFPNDSPATLLAHVIGIIGPINQDMLAKGRDTYKCFSKNHMLYEWNPDSNILEYLIPKKTSLQHRLPVGDQGFIDFVAHLLEVNPSKLPSGSEALRHPWLSYPYEPILS